MHNWIPGNHPHVNKPYIASQLETASPPVADQNAVTVRNANFPEPKKLARGLEKLRVGQHPWLNSRSRPSPIKRSQVIAKNQNTFAKRQREMEKKRKAEDKRNRRKEKKESDTTLPIEETKRFA